MKRTDKSLLEQMQISDAEISRRMTLLDLLTAQQAVIEDSIDDIVDEFYEAQTAVDEIALLIGDAETLARLRAAQRMYVIDLFRGIYDSEYVNNRLRIGMVHKRILSLCNANGGRGSGLLIRKIDRSVAPVAQMGRSFFKVQIWNHLIWINELELVLCLYTSLIIIRASLHKWRA